MKKFKHSEITPEKIYNKRRSFIKSMGYGLSALTLGSVPLIKANANNLNEPTSYKDITTYNNYYEFGTGKGDPHKRAKNFTTRPWSVKIEGEVEKSLELPIEEIKKSSPIWKKEHYENDESEWLKGNPIAYEKV